MCDKSFTLTHFHPLSETLLELAGIDHNARGAARPEQLTMPKPNRVTQSLDEEPNWTGMEMLLGRIDGRKGAGMILKRYCVGKQQRCVLDCYVGCK